MKCPNDQTEMEKGILAGGTKWLKGAGTFERVMSFGLGKFVTAWCCPKCGQIELYKDKS